MLSIRGGALRSVSRSQSCYQFPTQRYGMGQVGRALLLQDYELEALAFLELIDKVRFRFCKTSVELTVNAQGIFLSALQDSETRSLMLHRWRLAPQGAITGGLGSSLLERQKVGERPGSRGS